MVDEPRPPGGDTQEIRDAEGRVEEIRHPDGRIEHPTVRFEKSDASFGWAVAVVVIALALAAVIHFAVLWFFNDYRGYQAAIKRSQYPLAPAPATGLPAEPRLEQLDRFSAITTANANERQAAPEDFLHSYGESPEKGYVHVPIEQAMIQLANKLPARKTSPGDQSKANGLVDAGESNSGRMFRGQPR